MARLGEVCIVNPKGKTLSDELEVSFVPMQNVSEDGNIDITITKKYCDVKKGFTTFENGDILFAKITPCMENGKGGIARHLKNGIGFGSTEFHVLRPDLEVVTSEWIYYLTTDPEFRKRCEKNMTGSAGQKRVPKSFLETYEFSLPSLNEQRRIAAILDKVTGLIALRKQQLAKLDELVRARFVEMFGDLTLNPYGWKFQPLSALCDVRDGTHDSPAYVTDGYPLLTSKNFSSGVLDFSGANLISKNDFDKINQRSKVDKGDIVMPMIGTIGHPVIIDTDIPFAIKNVALIKFSEPGISNTFIRCILDSNYFLQTVQTANRGGTQKFISLGDIRKFPIPIIPHELQKKFFVFSEKVNAYIQIINQYLEMLEIIKLSLIQSF